MSGDTLYGAAGQGTWNAGTLFSIHTDGTGFTNFYNFTNGNDGNGPNGALILLENRLYGTTIGGGSNHVGTVFSVKTDGTGFVTLHEFTGIDGGKSSSNLILLGKTLYGTTQRVGLRTSALFLKSTPMAAASRPYIISSKTATAKLHWLV